MVKIPVLSKLTLIQENAYRSESYLHVLSQGWIPSPEQGYSPAGGEKKKGGLLQLTIYSFGPAMISFRTLLEGTMLAHQSDKYYSL